MPWFNNNYRTINAERRGAVLETRPRYTHADRRARIQGFASNVLRIGEQNIHGLMWRDKWGVAQKHDHISSKDLAHKRGWLEMHHIAVLVDTKLRDKDAKFFNNRGERHATCNREGNWGVTITWMDGIKEEANSLDWNLPEVLRHRFLAVKFSLPINYNMNAQAREDLDSLSGWWEYTHPQTVRQPQLSPLFMQNLKK